MRRGLMVAAVCVLLPGLARAQTASTRYAGFATVFLGGSTGGDVVDTALTPGVSVAIIESGGLGAEVDVSHVGEFDTTLLTKSGVTTLMFNATGVWSDPTALVRPYVTGGVGVLGVRSCFGSCESRTDWGFDAGGGAFVMFHEFFGVRGDVRYFRYAERHPDVPQRDTGIFDFWRVTAGFTLQWPMR